MARIYHVAEALGEVTNTSNTTWSDLVSLTFPTTAGKTYAVLWTGEFANQSNTSADYEIQITVDGSQVDYSNNEQRATTEYASHGGMLVVAGDGSTHTVAVQLQAETNGNTIKGKYGRVIALELGANDVVAEALSNQATTSTTMAAAVSAVVPASGDYLLIGTGFTRSFANSVPVYVDLHNGTTGTVQNGSSSAEISSNPSFVPSQQMWKTTLAASDTTSFRFRTHTAGSASDITNARILCLYLPDFDAAYYAETSADDSSANGTTETTALTLTETVTANPHLILGQWHTSSTTNSINLTSRLRDAGTLVSESIRRVYNAAQVRTQGSMSASVRDDYSAGSRSWTLTRQGAAAGNTTVIRQNSAIAVLNLGSAGGVDGNATGSSQTVTASVVGGAATGVRAPTGSGLALTIFSSLTGGSASGVRSATASGASVTVSASVAPGSASATRTGSASGAAWTVGASVAAGTGAGDGNAAGAALTAAAEINAGLASAAATGNAAGALLTVYASFTAGAASTESNGTATGADLSASTGIIGGAAAGQRNATQSGASLAISAAMSPGSASSQADASQAGASLSIEASVAGGLATGSAVAQGASLTVSLVSAFGTPTGGSEVPGAFLTAICTVIPGEASSLTTEDTPPERRFTLAAQDRSTSLAPDDRRMSLASEDRSDALTAIATAHTLPFQSRRMTLQ